MGKLQITLKRGDHSRLEELHGKAVEAVTASGINAVVMKGASAGGMTVHNEPEMTIDGRRVAHPESMTVEGLAELLLMAVEEAFRDSDGPLSLPFESRFRATGRTTDVAYTEIVEVVDDATGVLYLLAGGSLCPLLNPNGSPQRMR